MKSNSRYIHRYLFAALTACVLSISFTSCSQDSASGPSTMTASMILSADSTDNPNPCLVRAEWLADTLGLTDEQVAALTAAQDSLRAIAEAEIEAANGDRRSIRMAIHKYRESMKAIVQATLTAEQLALLESLRPPFHNRKHPERRGRDGDITPEMRAHSDSLKLVRLTEELGLTPEQVILVQALQADIRTNHPANPRKAFHEGMKTILTAEQLEQFEKSIPGRVERKERKERDLPRRPRKR